MSVMILQSKWYNFQIKILKMAPIPSPVTKNYKIYERAHTSFYTVKGNQEEKHIFGWKRI